MDEKSNDYKKTLNIPPEFRSKYVELHRRTLVGGGVEEAKSPQNV